MSTMTPTFDPNKQTYMDYLNSISGYGQNPFPAETSQPVQSDPYYQEGLQAGQQYAGTPKQNPVNTGIQTAVGVKSAADTANQVSNWLSPSITPSAPATSTGAEALSSGTPAAVSDYPATEALIQGGSQEGIAQGMSSAATAPSVANFGAVLPPAAVALTAAYTANKANQANTDSKFSSKNPITGLKTGIKDAGILNAVPVLGQAPWLAGIAGSVFGSSKDADQHARDQVRAGAQKSGWLDNNFQVPLENDLTLDLGKDGGFKYTNAGGQQRNAYDIDWSDPNASQSVGWLQPLASVLAKGDSKLTSDFTGQLYNELTKDGKATDLASIRKRVVELYNHFQLKPSIVSEAVKNMGLDANTMNAYLNAIDNLRPGQGIPAAQAPKLSMNGNSPADAVTPGKPKDPNRLPPKTQAPPLKPMGTGGLPNRPPAPTAKTPTNNFMQRGIHAWQ